MMFHKLRRRVGAKLRSHKGLSLLELLLTTIILLLITQIMADGIPVVIRLYRRTVDIANAQAYLSTTMIALRSKLSLASFVKTDEDDDTIIFLLDPEQGYYKITNGNKGIQIQYLDINMNPLQYKNPETNLPVDIDPLPLISAVQEAQNETNELISIYAKIEPEGNTFKIKGLKVIDKNGTLAKLEEDFIVHTVNQ